MEWQSIPLYAPVLSWDGAISTETVYFDQGRIGIRPWRIPFGQKDLFHPALQERARMAAGIRLTFRSDTSALRLTVVPTNEIRRFDLFCDRQFVGTVQINPNKTTAEWTGLGDPDKLVEIYLDPREVVVAGLEIADGASIAAAPDNRPRFIVYGSSITHCVGAHSPSRTWPAIVARRMNWRLTSLGFGGQCHLDALIARMIRDMPADFISCSFGINVYGGNTLNDRSFQPAVIGFLKIIREKHPLIPIAVCSPIISPPRENTPNGVGMTLEKMRRQIKEAVEILRGYGDKRFWYINGLDIFGEDELHLMPDGLHPNGDGYQRYAENYLRMIRETIPDLPGVEDTGAAVLETSRSKAE